MSIAFRIAIASQLTDSPTGRQANARFTNQRLNLSGLSGCHVVYLSALCKSFGQAGITN